MTCSSKSSVKTPLRIVVHCRRLSTVSWPGRGPAVAMTRFLNIRRGIVVDYKEKRREEVVKGWRDD